MCTSFEKGMKELLGYIHEPTDLQCGQAVLAMLLGVSVESVCNELQNERETSFREMKRFLENHGFKLSSERMQADTKADLPEVALLSLETPRCWHWSLHAEVFFTPPSMESWRIFPNAKGNIFGKLLLEHHIKTVRRSISGRRTCILRTYSVQYR